MTPSERNGDITQAEAWVSVGRGKHGAAFEAIEQQNIVLAKLVQTLFQEVRELRADLKAQGSLNEHNIAQREEVQTQAWKDLKEKINALRAETDEL
ncbi:hypothetical protein YB2330_003055 [Saitoella coloradoensis]